MDDLELETAKQKLREQLELIPGQGKPIKEDSPSDTVSADDRAMIPDYSLFRVNNSDSWTDIVEGENMADHVKSLITKFVLIPRADFQLPLMASYLMLPSALCNRVPIGFSHGGSGSGKSTLGHLACRIHDVKPISAGSTFASIRNAISAAKFNGGREKHCCIVWEDINPQELRKYEFATFSLLKNGVDRDGTITIAGEAGENLEFKIFSPKLISSIHALYALPEYRELIRRVMVFQHKPIQDWLATDHSSIYEGMSPDDLLDINDIDWDGFPLEFHQFWSDIPRCHHFSSLCRSLSKTKKHGMPEPLFKMSRDLIATGVVCGYWNTLQDAIDHVRQYWEWHKDNISDEGTALQKVLKRFIIDKSSEIEAKNELCRQANALHLIQEVQINPKELKDYVSLCIINGEVEPGTMQRAVNDEMNGLGWRLTLNDQQLSRWMKIAT